MATKKPVKKADKKAAKKKVTKSNHATSSGLNGASTRSNKLKASSAPKKSVKLSKGAKAAKAAKSAAKAKKAAKPKLPAPAPQINEEETVAHDESTDPIEELMLGVRHDDAPSESVKQASDEDEEDDDDTVGSAFVMVSEGEVSVYPDEETE